MAARGRPTACTQDTIDRYCDAIIDGLSLRSAAAEAGICTNTADNWAKRGEAGEEPFAEFLRQREKAIAVWERKRQAAMDEAGPQWAREAWRLERRLPDEYGKRERHELTGAGGGALNIVIAPFDTAADCEDAPDASGAGYHRRVPVAI